MSNRDLLLAGLTADSTLENKYPVEYFRDKRSQLENLDNLITGYVNQGMAQAAAPYVAQRDMLVAEVNQAWRESEQQLMRNLQLVTAMRDNMEASVSAYKKRIEAIQDRARLYSEIAGLDRVSIKSEYGTLFQRPDREIVDVDHPEQMAMHFVSSKLKEGFNIDVNLMDQGTRSVIEAVIESVMAMTGRVKVGYARQYRDALVEGVEDEALQAERLAQHGVGVIKLPQLAFKASKD